MYPDITFRFIGAVTDDLVCRTAVDTHFDRMSSSRGQSKVIFEGYLPDDALLDAYRSCDIFIAPSRFESFGFVAIEAMRFGKTVIGGRAGGLAEIIRHKENGILVNPDDADELCHAIIDLYNDAELRTRLGATALKDHREKYTVKKMVHGIELALADFLSREKERHRI